jgi:hypothetical protein
MTLATEEQFMPDGKRVCPRGESGCWWVVSGNPERGHGHECICLSPINYGALGGAPALSRTRSQQEER